MLYNINRFYVPISKVDMKVIKMAGFQRIYHAETFPGDFKAMFKKSSGQRKRYEEWLYTWLTVLDREGAKALDMQQFEFLRGTSNPCLYAIRHPHSEINERYIYVYIDGEAVVLLTAFKEKTATDYRAAISRAERVYRDLEESDDGTG